MSKITIEIEENEKIEIISYLTLQYRELEKKSSSNSKRYNRRRKQRVERNNGESSKRLPQRNKQISRTYKYIQICKIKYLTY